MKGTTCIGRHETFGREPAVACTRRNPERRQSVTESDGERTARTNRSLDDRAFTHGHDVCFGKDTYGPETESGRWAITEIDKSERGIFRLPRPCRDRARRSGDATGVQKTGKLLKDESFGAYSGMMSEK